jgi:hypothetical protein
MVNRIFLFFNLLFIYKNCILFFIFSRFGVKTESPSNVNKTTIYLF